MHVSTVSKYACIVSGFSCRWWTDTGIVAHIHKPARVKIVSFLRLRHPRPRHRTAYPPVYPPPTYPTLPYPTHLSPSLSLSLSLFFFFFFSSQLFSVSNHPPPLYTTNCTHPSRDKKYRRPHPNCTHPSSREGKIPQTSRLAFGR